MVDCAGAADEREGCAPLYTSTAMLLKYNQSTCLTSCVTSNAKPSPITTIHVWLYFLSIVSFTTRAAACNAQAQAFACLRYRKHGSAATAAAVSGGQAASTSARLRARAAIAVAGRGKARRDRKHQTATDDALVLH